MKRFVSLFIVLAMTFSFCIAEEKDERTTLYVIVKQLNGRYNPTKTSSVEARFDYGTELKATGRWSKDMLWVEVEGGECGNVWCKAEYLSEILEPVVMSNNIIGKVKIRSKPGKNGKVKGYVKTDQDIIVTQIVCGWGKTKKGWVDLSYFIYKEK